MMTINTDAKFWDGKNVTPEDVVYSLKRNTNAKLGGLLRPRLPERLLDRGRPAPTR